MSFTATQIAAGIAKAISLLPREIRLELHRLHINRAYRVPIRSSNGINAAPKVVRDTIEECLECETKTWTYKQISSLLMEKHGWKISQTGISKYRRRWLERKEAA